MSTPGEHYSIRHAVVDDAEAICRIYNWEVEHETSTFDIVPRSLETQRAWIAARSGAFAAIVAVDGADRVVGFGALSEYRDRAAEIAALRQEHGAIGNLLRRGHVSSEQRRRNLAE